MSFGRCAGWGGAYHELGVLGPGVGVKGDEEVLFADRFLGAGWRGRRGGGGGGVHCGLRFVPERGKEVSRTRSSEKCEVESEYKVRVVDVK